MQNIIENPTEEQLKTLTWIIYLITNKLNGMKYVGQSYTSFRKRYKTKNNWWKYTHNDYLMNTIKKYGIENFSISILEHNVKDDFELDNLETYYIKELNTLYPNGYNFDSGGNSNRYFCQKSRNKKAKQYKVKDRDGNIYEILNGLEFCRKHNLNRGDFWRMLKGEVLHTKGFYLPETNINIIRRDRGENGLIKLKDKNGIIHEFYDLNEFCNKNNISKSSVNGILNKENRAIKGWRLPETPDILEYIHPKNKKWKKLILTKDDKNYEVINASEFGRLHNFHPCAISGMVAGYLNQVKGFKLKEIIK